MLLRANSKSVPELTGEFLRSPKRSASSSALLRVEISPCAHCVRLVGMTRRGSIACRAADFIANELAAGTVNRLKRKRHSGLIPERCKLGKHLWRADLEQWGQRHDGILAVEHYLWYGDEDGGMEPLPGYHNDNARQALILSRVREP